MKLKKLAVLISAVMLTACGAELHGVYYETEKETESMIVSLTEPEPEPELPVQVWHELGMFLPIVDKYKENTELEDKFRPYLEKIILGEALLNYAQMSRGDIPYGEELIFPNEWVMLDKSFVSNKKQLLNFFDTVYTDNYKDGLYSCPFEEGIFGSDAETDSEKSYVGEQGFKFKEENGAVYKRIVWDLNGMKYYNIDGFRVRAYDKKTAEIGVCYMDGYCYGYEVLCLRNEEGKGWRLDSREADYKVRYSSFGNNMNFGTVPRTVLAALDEKLQGVTVGPEFVFTHFNETIDGEDIEYNGSKYYQVKNYYPVEKMRKAFANYISEYKWEWDDKAEDFVPTDEPLLQPCIEKYIDDVYVEFSGMLYRKEGAPVYEIDNIDTDSEEDMPADIVTPLHIVEVYTSGSGEKVLFVYEEESSGVSNYKLASDIPLREKEE